MQNVAGADATDFAEECLAFFTPFDEIRCAALFFGGAGKDEVGDFEIAFGTDVGRGLGIDRFGHEQRCLAHFEGGAVVAADGRIDFAFVDDGGVVADLRAELVLVAITAEEQGDDDEGIFFGDEAAAVF